LAATTNAEIMHRLFSGLFLYIVVACALKDNLIMKTGIELIAEERQRQIEKEGWTAEHDAEHKEGELAIAAACYAYPNYDEDWAVQSQMQWPWEKHWWKPSGDRKRDLAKAGALIAAEIDRLSSLQALATTDERMMRSVLNY
jgi:hypothetical protein